MKRKILPAILLATALAATACSSGGKEAPAPPKEPEKVSGSVTMWYPPIGGDIERKYWDDTIAKFQKTHPEIKVEVEIIPWDRRNERLQTAIAGDATPDVTYALPQDVYAWSADGILADLSEAVTDKDKYLPNAIEAMTVDGKLYAAPVLVGVLPTIYVKPIWDELGVQPADYPDTWDEVKEWAPKLKEKGYYITQYNGHPTQTLNGSYYQLLWANGGRVLSEDKTKPTVNSPEAVEALEFAKWLVDNDYSPKDAITQDMPVETSPIAQHKVAMLFSRSIESLTQNGLKAEELVIKQPLASKESLSYGNVAGWVIFDKSENKEAATVWINWLNQPENVKEFLPPRNQQSARTDVTGLYEEGSPEAEIAKILQHGIIEPASPHAAQIQNILKPHLQAALLGQKEPKAALDAAAAEIEQVLKG